MQLVDGHYYALDLNSKLRDRIREPLTAKVATRCQKIPRQSIT